ncbi:hypothetical protein C8R43DRAFT_1205530 [Mycena crocata]|nr:hypothetical protein C8R43DRAFT_1205530 [Mycena crocata]
MALNNQLDGALTIVAKAELVGARDILRNQVQSYTGILSAVWRIPSEILCYIFALTLPHGGDSVPTPPWHLEWISRRWRACAIAYGPLWASIYIDTSKTETDQLVSHFCPLAALETQLHRAANFDLEVTFTLGTHTPHLRAITDAAVVHSTRWASLTLHWTDETDTDRSLLPISGRLLNLRHLKVPGRAGLADLPEDLRQLFATAPQLRKLTHLTVFYAAHAYTYDSLCAATNLVGLGIEFHNDDEGKEWRPSTRPISLPHLRRLRVYKPCVLRFIEAPRLEFFFSYRSVDGVLPFLHRTNGQLVGLGTTLTNVDSLPLLRTLPHLLHLHLALIDRESEDFFAALTLSGGSDICPQLTSLRVFYIMLNASGHDALHAMVASRPTLTFLQMYSYSHFPCSQRSKLEALREGLKLLIGDPRTGKHLPETYPDMIPP